jgi:DNA-binding CsgD family transcriptional regulator
MTVLTAALEGSADAGGVAVLLGEAGVGKTRLAQELAAHARQGGSAVLAGRAVPGGVPVPYRPLTEAFLGAFRSGIPRASPELAGFGGHVKRLIPEWPGDAAGGADESPVLLGEAVVRLLGMLGGSSPPVLVLEDIHWADVETLAVVEYLSDALPAARAWCLCTARPGPAVAAAVERLRRGPNAIVLPLRPLSSTGVHRAVAACLEADEPPADVVEAVRTNSEGNPFLIEELLAGLVASGAIRVDDGGWRSTGRLVPSVPFDFAESVRQRLSLLDAAGRGVLRAAALLGRRFDWELLPGLLGVDGRAVIDALRASVDAQLVEAEGEVFRFRHALTREAVLAELLPPERRELARRALPAVERAHPGLPGGWCELAADLAEEAGERLAAAGMLVGSARRAMAAGALVSAETAAVRARGLSAGTPVADDADEVLVNVLASAGKPERAAAVGDALLERLAGRPGASERVANVLVVLGRAALAGGDTQRAEDMVTRGREVAGSGRPGVVATIDAVAAHVALEQGRLEEARTRANRALEGARATDQPAVECEALLVLGRVAGYGPDGTTTYWFEQAATVAGRHGLSTWEIRARHEVALVATYVGDDVAPLLEARALAARHGAMVSVAVMDLALAEIALGGFDHELCRAAAGRCVEASRRFGLATLPVANLWLAGGHALAGDVPAMEEAARMALEPDPDDPRILGDLWGRVRAASAIVSDDRDDLRRCLENMMGYVRVAPLTTSIYPNRIFWVLLRTIDDDDHGAAARSELASASHLRSWPLYVRALELIEAVALGRAGRGDEATRRYTSAATDLNPGVDEGSVQYFHALAAEAAIRDGWGDPVGLLRGAEAFFADHGYDRIVRRCRRLLAAAGAPVPRRRQGSTPVPYQLRALGVTGREVEVLELVADGLTNREVAARLYLSPKTVDRHVSNLFDRTGRRSRTELTELYRDLTG